MAFLQRPERFTVRWWGQLAGYLAAALTVVSGGLVGIALLYGVVLPSDVVRTFGRWLLALGGPLLAGVFAIMLAILVIGGSGMLLFVSLKTLALAFLPRLPGPDRPWRHFLIEFFAAAYNAR